jgi:hypothetical protein
MTKRDLLFLLIGGLIGAMIAARRKANGPLHKR